MHLPASQDPASRLLAECSAGPGNGLFVECGADVVAACAPAFASLQCRNSAYADHKQCREFFSRRETQGICRLGDIPEATQETGDFDAVLYRLGRAAAQAQAVIREAFLLLRTGGSLWVAGQTREGIKSFADKAESHFGNVQVVKIKSSCRLLRFRKLSGAPAQAIPDPAYFAYLSHSLSLPDGSMLGYDTKPGIFSYRATDAGTALLARLLPPCGGKQVLDLGCGSGVLSLAAFRLGAREVLAVDASAIAAACAARNFQAQGWPGRTLCTDFLEADEAEGVQGEFDLVFSNPPFHQGGETDYGLPGKILDAALLHLKPGGELFLVANQFLDYERRARSLFQEVTLLAREQGYSVYRMIR